MVFVDKPRSWKIGPPAIEDPSDVRHYVRGLIDGDGHIFRDRPGVSLIYNTRDEVWIGQFYKNYLSVRGDRFTLASEGIVEHVRLHGQAALALLVHLYEDCTLFHPIKRNRVEDWCGELN